MYLFRRARPIIVAIKLAAIIIMSAMIMACPPEPADPGSGNGNDNGSGNGGASRNIDSDSDGLIDINTIEDLNNIRYNLEGTSYKTSDSDTGIATGCPTDGCSGYELMRSLNFDTGAHYASEVVNNSWRPNNADSDMATNAGWAPIGNATSFAAIFEGNDNTITGLYTRGSGSIALFGATNSEAEIRNIGLIESASYGGDNANFVGALVGLNGGTITESYTNNGTANGGAGIDAVGALVGLNTGSITASHATNGTANNGSGMSFIGALVGFNVRGTITASYTDGGSANGSDSNFEVVGGLVGSNWGGMVIESYASATANGGGGDDTVGALVGFHYNNGTSIATIIASYATGTANGGAGNDDVGALVGVARDNSAVTASYATGTANGGDDDDSVGALVGRNNGAITASYAIGIANGGAGSDAVGALVGRNSETGAIAASYATGNANGDNDGDDTGALVGYNGGVITASYATGIANGGAGTDNSGTLVGFNDRGTERTGMIVESYGFGMVMGQELINPHGMPPTEVTAASGLTAENTGARWNAADDDTMGAWDFGDATRRHPPSALPTTTARRGPITDCEIFPETLPDDSAIACGTTLIPGQER